MKVNQSNCISLQNSFMLWNRDIETAEVWELQHYLSMNSEVLKCLNEDIPTSLIKNFEQLPSD